MEGRDLRAAYEEDLNRLKTAQRNAAVADLQNTRNQALSNLEAERNSNTAFYNQQRSTANAQNRMNARNFQEYLASTGRANSGLSAQARLQNANNLATSINNLNVGEAGALADINRRTALANDTYNTGLAGANAQIEANYIQNLINERNKELERQMQERQFQEQIRQFNENLALQRQQLQSRYASSGSGSNNDYTFTNNSYAVNTPYYQGDLNADANRFGTFSNGYQPKGIEGHGTLSKSGDTVTFNTQTLGGQKQTVTQNIWKAQDGTKWYWDGRVNKYLPAQG